MLPRDLDSLVPDLPSVLAGYARVLDSLPIVTWIADVEGTVTYISPQWEEFTGMPGEKMLELGYSHFVHPADLPAVAARGHAACATGRPYRDEVRMQLGDGTYRWVLSEAKAVRDGRGAVTGWVGSVTDIDDRVRSDAGRELFVKLAETSRDIIGMTDVRGKIVYVNPAAVAFFESTQDELLGRHFFEFFVEDDLSFLKSVVVPTLERGGRWARDFRFRSFRTGRALPIMCDAFAIFDASGAVSGFATISRDLRERQRIEIGMRALADAGKAMHESLDFDETMQNIANATVAGFCNACSVEVPVPDGSIRTITLATRDPAQSAIALEASKTRNAGMPLEHPVRWAIRDGISTLKQVADAPFLASTGIDRHIGSQPGRLDICSLIYVPIRSQRDGRIYGSLSCGLYSGDPRGYYVEDDVRFAEEIAIRAGLAFDNAHAYERTRRVAVEMQAASLPLSLPQTPEIRIDAQYHPATDEALIGGDWYDAFRLPDGRIVMTIGDVAGHGLHAATWMTRVRQAMQAAAMLDPDPRVMLSVANRTLRMHGCELYATAMAAIYDATTRTLHLASAGHPSPLVARADGSVDELPCHGVLLNVVDEPSYELCAVEIVPGDLVVLYTDGLVEIERDFERGQSRLREAVCHDDIRTSETPALAIYERITGGATVQDDIAILTLLARSANASA